MGAELRTGLGGGAQSSPPFTLPQVKLLSRESDQSVTSWGLWGHSLSGHGAMSAVLVITKEKENLSSLA